MPDSKKINFARYVENSIKVLETFRSLDLEVRRSLLDVATERNADIFLKAISSVPDPSHSALVYILLAKGVSSRPISNVPGSVLLRQILTGESSLVELEIDKDVVACARKEVVKGIRLKEDTVFLSDDYLDSELSSLKGIQSRIKSSDNIIMTVMGTSKGLRHDIGNKIGAILKDLYIESPGLKNEVTELSAEMGKLLDRYIPQDPS